jgi:transketolase C-terminal domain/subunit
METYISNMKDTPKEHLRKAFIETMTYLADCDDRVMLIYGDVGFSYMDDFIKRFPNQSLNAGIAEQNMMGMAAGLTIAGWKPYVYTMSNFILLRPLEQVRNDIDFSYANVKLFGVKGGPAYKFLGHSHNLLEGEEKAILDYSLPSTAQYFSNTEKRLKEDMLFEYELSRPAYFSI